MWNSENYVNATICARTGGSSKHIARPYQPMKGVSAYDTHNRARTVAVGAQEKRSVVI